MWQIILAHVVGGVLATMGGIAAIWYQAKKARKIRIDEIMAEKQLEAWGQAHNLITRLRSIMIQQETKDVGQWISQNEEWFFANIPFLPNKFVNKWLSIRKYWKRVVRLDDAAQQMKMDDARRPTTIDKSCDSEEFCRTLADEALAELECNLGIEPIRIENISDAGNK